jgi:hypothetical protein
MHPVATVLERPFSKVEKQLLRTRGATHLLTLGYALEESPVGHAVILRSRRVSPFVLIRITPELRYSLSFSDINFHYSNSTHERLFLARKGQIHIRP